MIPAVTVITPAHDAAPFIERAIASVLAQTRTDWELIVVDDGSQDRTPDLVSRAARKDGRIRHLRREEASGPAAARNAGLALARGRHIAFLDADDEWLPSKLARHMDHMAATGAVLGYTGYDRVRPGQPVQRVRVPATVSRAALLRGNVIGCLTAIYDRAALGDVPMPDLALRQDFATWLTILERIPVAHGLDEPLSRLHLRADSISADKRRATHATWHMYRRHLGMGRLRSAWYISHHLAGRLGRR